MTAQSTPEWLRSLERERAVLRTGGIPHEGDASGWVIMLQNNVGKALKAFVDADDGDTRKFLFRVAALATLWAELLVDEREDPKAQRRP